MTDANAHAEDEQPSAQRTAQNLLGAMLISTGAGHLTFLRKPFHAQVPPWVPMDVDRVVTLSGIAEITLGAALLLAKKRRVPVGWAAAAFFCAIFPGNIAQWQHHRSAFGLNTDAKRFARLFGQPVLLAWALWSTGALQAKRNHPKRAAELP